MMLQRTFRTALCKSAAIRSLSAATATTASDNAVRSSLNPARFQLRSSTAPSSSSMSMSDMKEGDLAYALSFAQEAAAAGSEATLGSQYPDSLRLPPLKLNDRMKEQLANCSRSRSASQKISTPIDSDPLPRTLQDALRPSQRAIVITEANKPFGIFNVNDAWTDLCGYSFVEAQGKTLGSLLHGPETDARTTTALLAQLLAGEPEVAAQIVNYKKGGEKFNNRVRVGPLMDDDHHVTHFVGVLQEVPMQQQMAA